MDESKTLINMSVSVMFSGLILAAAVGLVTIGYSLFSYLSNQDQANKRMHEYIDYTSFDNTVIRGQEAVQLIQSDYDIFVIIYNGKEFNDPTKGSIRDVKSTMTTGFDGSETNNPVAVYTADVRGIRDFDLTHVDITSTDITGRTALNNLKSLNTTPMDLKTRTGVEDLSTWKYSKLVSAFTDSKDQFGKPLRDNNGIKIQSSSYAAFHSSLVYAEDGTTDVVGVVLVREPYDTLSYE